MMVKLKEKEVAIKLRKEGKTYFEILKEVPVAKSTLSLWLRDVGLSTTKRHALSQKRIDAQKRGAAARRRMRQESTRSIYAEAIKNVGSLSGREKWLLGVALYWAEGSKEKEARPGQGVDFGNTDHKMIKFFLDWLQDIGVRLEEITFSLYIHKNREDTIKDVISFWKKALEIPDLKFSYIYFKQHNPKTKRQNIGDLYHGTLRLRVRKSTTLQRKISGWTYGITGAPLPPD